MKLRLASPPRPPVLSRDSGPGLRWLVFTQGCRHPCTEVCLNPAYLDPRGGSEVSLGELELVARLLRGGGWGPVEGLTLLGGEPSDQAGALAPFLVFCREIGLSVMLYSGRTLAALSRDPARAALLPLADILVDGPFLPDRAEPGLRWRGSTNQQIHLLTTRYGPEDTARDLGAAGMTLTVPSEGALVVSGLQRRADAEVIEALVADVRAPS